MPVAKVSPISSSLGLTGEYIYLQIRTLGGGFFNVHFDFGVADRNMLERITLTNMRASPVAQARVILYPLKLVPDEWTTVRLHIPEVLLLFGRIMPHAHVLKSVQICASCCVRGVYTSDQVFKSHAELPREMKFSQKEKYECAWVNVPAVDAQSSAGGSTAKVVSSGAAEKSTKEGTGTPAGTVKAGGTFLRAGSGSGAMGTRSGAATVRSGGPARGPRDFAPRPRDPPFTREASILKDESCLLQQEGGNGSKNFQTHGTTTSSSPACISDKYACHSI